MRAFMAKMEENAQEYHRTFDEEAPRLSVFTFE